MAPHVAADENVAVLFGRERWGLENDEVALADRIVTFPVNPAFASLNLAQAVALVAYEWFKLATAGALPFAMPQKSAPARKEQTEAFFANLERELDKIEYFRPLHKRATMLVNLRNIFARMQPTQQDVQTLHGVVMALSEGRKGPARGGVLDGEEAKALRALLAEHGEGPGAGRARTGARALAAVAPQSDRGRARLVGRAHQGPALRRQGLQAPGSGRAAHHRFRVVCAARGHRAGSGGRKRHRGQGADPTGAPGSPSAATAYSMCRWREVEADLPQLLDRLAQALPKGGQNRLLCSCGGTRRRAILPTASTASGRLVVGRIAARWRCASR